MKVCYIVDTAVGAAWAFEQLRGLRDRYGIEVTAIITGCKGSLADKLRSEEIPFHVWSFGFASLKDVWSLPFKVIGLAHLFRRERFDVVQTHLFRSMIIGRLAAWLADVPVRLAMIAGPYHLEAHILRWIDRSTCRMDTAVIASCEFTRSLYRRMGVPDTHLELIYYGTDESKFNPEQFAPAKIRQEYGWPADTTLVGMVAYFYPPWGRSGLTPPHVNGRGIKGHEYLIEAVPAILAEFPKTKLLLIGSAFSREGQRYMDELKEHARRLGLQESIIFAGFRSDINNVLRALDVSVQPSLNENLGGTIESLLMECPLVATRVGGMVDSVRDGETGVLVEPSNADELAQGILQHSVIGYNYRMSNVLAAIGRAQLRVLPERLAARRRNCEQYRAALAQLPGIEFMPQASYGQSNCWLTCLLIDPQRFGATREQLRLALEAENIESRRVWKPLHLQPVFAQCRVRGGSVAQNIAERGLCLPSGSSLSEHDRQRIITIVRQMCRAA